MVFIHTRVVVRTIPCRAPLPPQTALGGFLRAQVLVRQQERRELVHIDLSRNQLAEVRNQALRKGREAVPAPR